MYNMIISCEHAVNYVPPEYEELFPDKEVLTTHRGWDRGAAVAAQHFAEKCNAPCFYGSVSRLLIDCNRSEWSRNRFSQYSRILSDKEKQRVESLYYTPLRSSLSANVEQLVAQKKRVIHLSVHSFTPVLGGSVRRADIGLLYDPGRSGEKALCHLWKKSLESASDSLIVRRNYPYKGKSDGTASWLRKQFSSDYYLGIELEINQSLPGRNDHNLFTLLSDTFVSVVDK